MKQDPPRLLDSLAGSDPLKRALDAARADGPDRARLKRLASQLPLGLPHGGGGGGGGGGPSGSSAPTLSGGSPIFSGALIGAALGVAVVGASWLVSPRAEVAPSPSSIVASAPAPRVAEATPQSVPKGELKAPLPSEARAAEKTALPVQSSTSAPPPSAPATAVAETKPGDEGAGPALVAPQSESETAMLQRAQDALGSSPSKALSIANECVARYPGGALAQEREVLAIQALMAMGRVAEGRARASSFVAQFPGSAHRRRIEVLLGEDLDHKKRETAPSTP